MKKLLLLVLFIPLVSIGQEFTVTPDGLKDKVDVEKTYVVINTPDKTAEQNYNNAIKHINKIYKNPEEVIKGNVKDEFLKFDTFVSNFIGVKNGISKVDNDATYTIALSFKGNRVKFEVVALDIYNDSGYRVLFSGGALSGFAIYNKKKTKLRLPEVKSDIETYFNNEIKTYESIFLETSASEDDDW